MTLRSSIWLNVCLCLGLSAGNPLLAAASGNPVTIAAGDVPASHPSNKEADRRIGLSSVANDEMEILERARAANENLYSALQSFVCNEAISRFRGSMDGSSSHPLDTVTAKLSFERGVEQYSDVYQNNHQRAGISSLAGAWSEGEYGTLLIQTQQLLTTQTVSFETFGEVKGERAAIYHFDVSTEESPWDLLVGGRHYRLAFSTDVWISVESGEILKINRISQDIAAETHISEIQWGITLDRVSLSGRLWLLPTTGSYSVLYHGSHRREWNLISFSNYQRYGAQTALKFD